MLGYTPHKQPLQQMARILLECILVEEYVIDPNTTDRKQTDAQADWTADCNELECQIYEYWDESKEFLPPTNEVA